MSIIESVLLGLTQGLTEFIPVSSSGHLGILQHLFSGASDHLFLEFINIGTLLALLIFFRHKIWHILKDIFIKKRYALAINLILTSIPAGLVGFLLADFIGSSQFFGSLYTVTISMGLVGIVMIILDKLPTMKSVKKMEKLPKRRALTIGLAQVFALIPGVSRSGSTIITGKLMGFSSALAAEYSFLASIPIMLGVTLKMFIKSADRAYFFENFSTLVLSNLVAFIFGILAIKILLKYLAKKNSLKTFGWYRVLLSSTILIAVLTAV
ncbi:MAG: undecaprenyl-diphosphate phosphatase [Candidatus Nomurabacteria bacterium]|jgi:undecaprenyl-diphosphatase|nr:undecaprenyl-diphosphate phosphatase [Candidatus Nomurabacteria bacterium]